MKAYIKAAGLVVVLMAAAVPVYADDYTLAVAPSAVQLLEFLLATDKLHPLILLFGNA